MSTLSKSAIETLKPSGTTASIAPLNEVVIVDPLMFTPDIVGAFAPAAPAAPAVSDGRRSLLEQFGPSRGGH